jgi:pseudouridine-5'-phosphate glycosidase
MMVAGKDVALKVLGKKILEGTVKSVMVEAGKKTALTVAATTFSPLKFIAGFGITMVIGAGIGGVKALIKSGWENQEVEIVNVNSDFNFSKL